jgi:hypothetical protein
VNSRSRSRAFFLELVLNLVVFSVCAIVSLYVFVSAKSTSTEASALGSLTVESQRIAETFKASGGDTEKMRASLAPSELIDGVGGPTAVMRWHYDGDLKLASADGSRYTISCTTQAEQPLRKATIVVLDQGEEILRLNVSTYLPDAAGRPFGSQAAGGQVSGAQAAGSQASGAQAGAATGGTGL